MDFDDFAIILTILSIISVLTAVREGNSLEINFPLTG